jgi:hypothetical protein
MTSAFGDPVDDRLDDEFGTDRPLDQPMLAAVSGLCSVYSAAMYFL